MSMVTNVTETPPSAWLRPRFAVIPTTGRDCFYRAAEAIRPQVDQVLVIKTPGPALTNWDQMLAHEEKSDTKNISAWWNKGFKCAKFLASTRMGATAWDVAVLNDDVIVGPTWFDELSETLRRTGVAVTSLGDVGMPVLHSKPGPIPLSTRPQGFAWMTAGEKGLRADETLMWWYGDDDLWAQAIANGGIMIIPGRLTHLYPNGQMTADLQVQAAKDRETFVTKHGWAPW